MVRVNFFFFILFIFGQSFTDFHYKRLYASNKVLLFQFLCFLINIRASGNVSDDVGNPENVFHPQ